MRLQKPRLLAVAGVEYCHEVAVRDDHALAFDTPQTLEQVFHFPLKSGHIFPANENSIIDFRPDREDQVEIVRVDAPLSHPGESMGSDR